MSDWRSDERIEVDDRTVTLKIGNQYFPIARADHDDPERDEFVVGMATMLEKALDANDAAVAERVLRNAAKRFKDALGDGISAGMLNTLADDIAKAVELGLDIPILADELDPKGGSDE